MHTNDPPSQERTEKPLTRLGNRDLNHLRVTILPSHFLFFSYGNDHQGATVVKSILKLFEGERKCFFSV